MSDDPNLTELHVNYLYSYEADVANHVAYCILHSINLFKFKKEELFVEFYFSFMSLVTVVHIAGVLNLILLLLKGFLTYCL